MITFIYDYIYMCIYEHIYDYIYAIHTLCSIYIYIHMIKCI